MNSGGGGAQEDDASGRGPSRGIICGRLLWSPLFRALLGMAGNFPVLKSGTAWGNVKFGSRSGLWAPLRYRVHQLVSSVSCMRLGVLVFSFAEPTISPSLRAEPLSSLGAVARRTGRRGPKRFGSDPAFCSARTFELATDKT
jgi:hypothetical protein